MSVIKLKTDKRILEKQAYTNREWEEVKTGKIRLPYCPDSIGINSNGTVTIYPPDSGYIIGKR